jgi:hypothetical protein
MVRGETAQKSVHSGSNRRILSLQTEWFIPLHSILLHWSDISLDCGQSQKENWTPLSVFCRERQEGVPSRTVCGVSIREEQDIVFIGLIPQDKEAQREGLARWEWMVYSE